MLYGNELMDKTEAVFLLCTMAINLSITRTLEAALRAELFRKALLR